MRTSTEGKQFIRLHEGLRLQAYLCPAGVWTIGWGHTKGVHRGQTVTEAQAEDMLVEDLAPVERALNTMSINFRQEQFDALASWIFNLGLGKFVSSTLCKKIQAGADDEAVAAEIVKWVYSGGKPLAGLMKRRVSEANMFLGRERYQVINNKIIKV